ncbi:MULTISPECIES: hypothetical protein [unclassified Sphingopyxis]|nr:MULTISPECIES: hypothetical protein [unclassified Sphingopyxis]KTE48874.1 hypothetical protein ATE64_20145 [Sphingopyxis sp. H073]KTE53315.1 hypothetical protein ATE69_13455 [Sphingopyxis sp. H071]
MTYIPTLDEMAAAIAPLMKLRAKMKLQGAIHRWSNMVTADLVLTAVDAPEPFPKKMTPLYHRREREFGERLEKALGPNWIVVAQLDLTQPVWALHDNEAVRTVLYAPDKTILLYSKQGDDIVPGTDKRSGTSISFGYIAAEFETEELKVAWQICR